MATSNTLIQQSSCKGCIRWILQTHCSRKGCIIKVLHIHCLCKSCIRWVPRTYCSRKGCVRYLGHIVSSSLLARVHQKPLLYFANLHAPTPTPSYLDSVFFSSSFVRLACMCPEIMRSMDQFNTLAERKFVVIQAQVMSSETENKKCVCVRACVCVCVWGGGGGWVTCVLGLRLEKLLTF